MSSKRNRRRVRVKTNTKTQQMPENLQEFAKIVEKSNENPQEAYQYYVSKLLNEIRPEWLSKSDVGNISVNIGTALASGYSNICYSKQLVHELKISQLTGSLNSNLNIDITKGVSQSTCQKIANWLNDRQMVQKWKNSCPILSDWIDNHRGNTPKQIQDSLTETKNTFEKIVKKTDIGKLSAKMNQLLGANLLCAGFTLAQSWYTLSVAGKHLKQFERQKNKLEELKKDYVFPVLKDIAAGSEPSYYLIKLGLAELDVLKQECIRQQKQTKSYILQTGVTGVTSASSAYSTLSMVNTLASMGNPYLLALNGLVAALSAVTSGVAFYQCYKHVKQHGDWTKLIQEIEECISELEKAKKQYFSSAKEIIKREKRKLINNKVELWLFDMELHDTWKFFEENGFKDLDSLKYFHKEEQLKNIGIMQQGSRIKLLRQIRKLKGDRDTNSNNLLSAQNMLILLLVVFIAFSLLKQ